MNKDTERKKKNNVKTYFILHIIAHIYNEQKKTQIYECMMAA